MPKEKTRIFTVRYIARYKNSLKKRKAARWLCIVMYPVQLLTLGCWPESLPEIWMIPYTLVCFAAVLLFLTRMERTEPDTVQIAVGEKNTTFHFICDAASYLEYAFANDCTVARKKNVFHPFHVEVIIKGKGRHGLIALGEAAFPDEIQLDKEQSDKRCFQYAMDTTLCFYISARELKKAEEKVPFLMGLHREL